MSSSSRLSRLRQKNGVSTKTAHQPSVKNESIEEGPTKLTLKQIAVMHEQRIQHLEKMNKNLLEELESLKETLRTANVTMVVEPDGENTVDPSNIIL